MSVDVQIKSVALHGRGKVLHVQLVHGLMSQHDQPIVLTDLTQCLLEPWELFGTVLRDHVLMKLTRTLEIVMSSAQWTRGVHSTARVISGSRWRSELGDARRSIDKDHREILICSIDCHALAVVSVVHDPVILYLVGKWVRETERERRERERDELTIVLDRSTTADTLYPYSWFPKTPYLWCEMRFS